MGSRRVLRRPPARGRAAPADLWPGAFALRLAPGEERGALAPCGGGWSPRDERGEGAPGEGARPAQLPRAAATSGRSRLRRGPSLAATGRRLRFRGPRRKRRPFDGIACSSAWTRAVATRSMDANTETTRSRWGVRRRHVRGRVDRHERFSRRSYGGRGSCRGETTAGTRALKKPSQSCVGSAPRSPRFAEGVPKGGWDYRGGRGDCGARPRQKIVVLGITPRGERVGNTRCPTSTPRRAGRRARARARAPSSSSRFGKRDASLVRKGKRRGGTPSRLAAVPERGVPAVRGPRSLAFPAGGGGSAVDERRDDAGRAAP